MSKLSDVLTALFRRKRHWYAVCPVCATDLKNEAAKLKYANQERQP